MPKNEIKTFEDLDCWKACRELRFFVKKEVLSVLPKEEKWRLADQIIRADHQQQTLRRAMAASATLIMQNFAAIQEVPAGRYWIIS